VGVGDAVADPVPGQGHPAGLEPVPDPIANLYRPQRILATTGAPLEYPRVDTPAHVRFVGAQLWDPPVETTAWLDEPGDPSRACAASRCA
jgi:hypothetical protein